MAELGQVAGEKGGPPSVKVARVYGNRRYWSNWTEIFCESIFWPSGGTHQIQPLRLKDAEDIGWCARISGACSSNSILSDLPSCRWGARNKHLKVDLLIACQNIMVKWLCKIFISKYITSFTLLLLLLLHNAFQTTFMPPFERKLSKRNSRKNLVTINLSPSFTATSIHVSFRVKTKFWWYSNSTKRKEV